MDDSHTYMNVKFTKTHSRSPSRDSLNTAYSELNFQKEKPCTDEDEDVPISSGPGELSTTARTGTQKQNIDNGSYCKICLLGLVTFGLGATVVGLSIYVSQTRQSPITSDREYRRLWEQHHEMNRTQDQCEQEVHELNSALQSRTSENSRLDLSQRICLKNLSALNNNLAILENNISVLKSDLSEMNRAQTDLRLQFNQLEMKNRDISETKAQICQYLTRRREQTCPQNWVKNEDRCYFISTNTDTYDGARQRCSELDSRLLEINSNEEKNFVSNAVSRYVTYWIGKCADRNVASDLLYKMSYRSPSCSKCASYSWSYSSSCNGKYRFICERSVYSYPDIPEEIRGLCQQTVGPTSIE